MNTVQEIIPPDRLMIKARNRVIGREHFFGSIILKLDLVEEPGLPTMATDGKNLYYGPDYVANQDFKILMTDICHEGLHCGLCHHVRRGNRDPKLWNYATDYAVNWILKEFGLEMDDTYLYDPKYADMTAETIYKILKKEQSENKTPQGEPCCGIREPKSGKGDGDSDGDKEGKKGSGQPLSPAEIAAIEFEAKFTMKAALQAAKNAGKLPGKLSAMFESFCEPKLPWQNLLRQFLEVVTKNDYTWTRPNRRYITQGFVLPTLYSRGIGTLVVMLDTSASVNNPLLKSFLTELSGMLTYVNMEMIYLLLIDTKVHGCIKLTKSDLPLKVNVKGRGGTNFVPGFDYIKENGIRPNCIIYLTDMECLSYPAEAPNCHTLWCTETKNPRYLKPPFGTVIQIEE